MHSDELWQEYGENGEPLANGGRPSHLGNHVEGRDFYGGTIVWLYRVNNGNFEVLFQKRSEKVDRYPGKWDCSVGGHVNYGETFADAGVRELGEEIGIHGVKKEDLEFVTAFKGDLGIYTMFVLNFTGHKEDFAFDDGEVAEVKWVPLDEYDYFRQKYGKDPLAKDDLTSQIFVNYFENKIYHNGNLDKS